MNFSFRILRLGSENRRCQIYTILIEGNELHEAVKFIQNPVNKNSEDFDRLRTRLENIKNRHGALISFFKPEGKDSGLVHALHAGVKKQGYLQVNHLRWYSVRLSERCVILGNGGVKHVRKTQDDDHLKEKELAMRWVDKVIDIALRNKDLIMDDAGNLVGALHFTIERIEYYGLS